MCGRLPEPLHTARGVTFSREGFAPAIERLYRLAAAGDLPWHEATERVVAMLDEIELTAFYDRDGRIREIIQQAYRKR